MLTGNMMLKVSDFLFEGKSNSSRKYVSVILSDKTQKRMRAWCQENGFDISSGFDGNPGEFNFHITIMCSMNETNFQNNQYMLSDVVVEPKQLKYLGAREDIPVIEVSSPTLIFLNKMFQEFGMESSYPGYIPHVTVSYKYSEIKGVKLPTFPLAFNQIAITDITE